MEDLNVTEGSRRTLKAAQLQREISISGTPASQQLAEEALVAAQIAYDTTYELQQNGLPELQRKARRFLNHAQERLKDAQNSFHPPAPNLHPSQQCVDNHHGLKAEIMHLTGSRTVTAAASCEHLRDHCQNLLLGRAVALHCPRTCGRCQPEK